MVVLKIALVFCASGVLWGSNGFKISEFSMDKLPPPIPLNKEWSESSHNNIPLVKKYSVSQENATWDQAKAICEKKGMRLANLDGKNELYLLEKYINQGDLLPKDVYSGYWVAGQLNPQITKWVWVYTNKPISLKSFVPGEPNDYEEYCVELKNDLYFLGLNNYFCGDVRKYICEETIRIESIPDDGAHYYVIPEETKEAALDEANEEIPERVRVRVDPYRFPFFHRARIYPRVSPDANSDSNTFSEAPEISVLLPKLESVEASTVAPEEAEVEDIEASTVSSEEIATFNSYESDWSLDDDYENAAPEVAIWFSQPNDDYEGIPDNNNNFEMDEQIVILNRNDLENLQ